MANEIISYIEMCTRESSSLQRGMNFNLNGDHSVILMSVRPGAPYRDKLEDEGTTLIYEGHDVPRTQRTVDPKKQDQPEYTPSGGLTENGKFHRSAQEFKKNSRTPERVRVYEKLRNGIWSYNGVFHLVDSWIMEDGTRKVFNFKLVAVEGDEDFDAPPASDVPRRRVIPTTVKLEVWKRDELHFDHILPYARGGTSVRAENVQILCARHNLEKRDQII